MNSSVFDSAFARFEIQLGKDVFEASQTRVEALKKALNDPDFATKSFKSLEERKSKVLEMVKDESQIEAMKLEMLEKLKEADGNAYAQAALCKQLTPAVETMLGAPLEA